jgi:hypothetical protein
LTIHEARKPPAPVTHTVSPETDEPSTGILSFSRGRENVLFVVGEKGRRELEETRREALDKKETSCFLFKGKNAYQTHLPPVNFTSTGVSILKHFIYFTASDFDSQPFTTLSSIF